MSNSLPSVKKPSLLDMGNEFAEIMRSIYEDQAGEITEEQENKIQELLVSTKEKVTNYSAVLKHLTAEIEMAERAAREAQEYAEKCSKIIDRLLYVAGLVMNKMNTKKLEGLNGTGFFIRTTESLKVEIDPNELPIKFQRTVIKTEADKRLIKEAIKNGETVQGCVIVNKQNVNWK